MSDKRQICLRCTAPVATAADAEVWDAVANGERERPEGWPDDDGSHLCWHEVAKGDCVPGGDRVRVTNGLLVLHDGDAELLSAPVGEVLDVIGQAGGDAQAMVDARTAMILRMAGLVMPIDIYDIARSGRPLTGVADEAAGKIAALRAAAARSIPLVTPDVEGPWLAEWTPGLFVRVHVYRRDDGALWCEGSDGRTSHRVADGHWRFIGRIDTVTDPDLQPACVDPGDPDALERLAAEMVERAEALRHPLECDLCPGGRTE